MTTLRVRWLMVVRGAVLMLMVSMAAGNRAEAITVMPGFADQRSISLFLQDSTAQVLKVEVFAAQDRRALQVLEAVLTQDQDLAATLRIARLEPGQTYRYLVRNARGVELARGEFRTQALWQWRGDPPTVRIALGSCTYIDDGKYDRPGTPYGGGLEIFDAIAAKQPDLMFWLGDNLYFREVDWTSREGMMDRHRFYRTHPALAKLLASTQHIAIWDDHDFGPNDADSSFVNKRWALEAFQRYWPTPYAPRNEGNYGMVSLGDIDILLLDDRWFRSPNRAPDTPEKTLFGKEQFQWLKAALLSSTARFKLVAAGGQFWNQGNRFEGLQEFPAEQADLRKWLEDTRIPGVIFVSGDRHISELLRIERPGLYPLVELTTSPLTAGPVRTPNDSDRNNPDVVPGSLLNQRSFAMITASGPATDRSLSIEMFDSHGQSLFAWQVRASELAPATPEKPVRR